MLTANTGNLPALDAPSQPELAPAVISPAVDNSLGARDQSLAISAVHVLIDGREVTLTSLEQPLVMEVGSSLEIVGIEYRLNGDETIEGRIAFEGYLNKLHGSKVRTDYRDGRFGGHEQEGELPFGTAKHSGLNGAWKMEAGTESISLVMVRYGAEDVVVEDRIQFRTQVGTPDFVMHPEIIVKGSSRGIVAGRTVKLYGAWGNTGEGTYRNYMEVDIYHESDSDKIVWSGVIADVVTAGDYDRGQFVNKVKQDGFSKHWVPELGGSYTLKFYVDPENQWNESNEENNVGYATLNVQDLRQVARGRDASGGFGFNHHSVSDVPTADATAHDAAMAIAASDLNARTEQLERESDLEESVSQVVVEMATTQVPAIVVGTYQEQRKDLSNRDEGLRTEDWLEAIDAAISDSLL